MAPDDPFWDKVELGQWHLIGPRLAGTIVFLAMRMRLSRARIREFLIELFDLQLSTGVLDETIREAGRAVVGQCLAIAVGASDSSLCHDKLPRLHRQHSFWLSLYSLRTNFTPHEGIQILLL